MSINILHHCISSLHDKYYHMAVTVKLINMSVHCNVFLFLFTQRTSVVSCVVLKNSGFEGVVENHL